MTQQSLLGAAVTRSKPSRSSNGFVSSVWEFPPTDDVSYAGHSIYRWYGTLPGPLVGRLLDLYAESIKTPIWDPMCGVGATLVEARLRGVAAMGWDVNPLAVLISQTKLDPYPGAVRDTIEALHEVREMLDREGSDLSSFDHQSYDYARKWFAEAGLERLLNVAVSVSRLDAHRRLSRLLLVALASVTRDVAEVDPRCTHHLVRKSKPYADAMSLLEKRAISIAEDVAEVPLSATGEDEWPVQQATCLTPTPPQSDLVIAHPPYLGVIHYHLIHRLGTELLRFVQELEDPPVLRGLDFASEALRERDASTDRDQAYFEFLESLTNTLQRSTAEGGRCVIIIGDSRHKGLLRHPFTDIVALMESRGFRLEENFIWVLQNNGGMHVRRRGHHIDHNYIPVFRRQQ